MRGCAGDGAAASAVPTFLPCLQAHEFERLLIFADGSGVALSLRPADASRLTNALIPASGPLGPGIAGSLLIVAPRSNKTTRAALMALGAALIISLAGPSCIGNRDPCSRGTRYGSSAALWYPVPWRPGLHQRLAAIRLPVQFRRKRWRSAASIRYGRHRRCPAASLLVLGISDQRGDHGPVMVELHCRVSTVMHFFANWPSAACRLSRPERLRRASA